ncbi:MAG: hypothetical protein FH748_03190 [Balneolaceae bacterium]|nr:hypothetical protein [Balneolaceae bacterium]
MNKLSYWILITVVLSVLSCSKTEQNTNYNLVFEKHIGNEIYEGFIGTGRTITSDYQRYLYVDDITQVYVKQYDLDGNFIRNIGREGRGPGEFPTSNIMSDVRGSLIAVNDLSGFRVSVFDTSGTFKFSFPTQRRYITPTYIIDSTLISGDGGSTFERDLKGKYQFSKFNFDGELISRFVPYPISEKTSDYPARVFQGRIEVSNGLLHIAYLFVPLYQIYDIESEKLLYEFNLADFPGFEIDTERKSIKGNYPQTILKSMEELQQYLSYLHVIDNNIFIMRMSNPYVIIENYELEKDSLKHINTYAASPKILDAGRILDFIYIPQTERFYFAQSHNEEGIVVSVFRHEEQLK